VFGWGGAGGRVYQKAYVEFFTSPANLRRVLETCSDRLHLDYYAVDAKGQSYSRGSRGTTALTWGVFPNKEVRYTYYCMLLLLLILLCTEQYLTECSPVYEQGVRCSIVC
jgi:hypothetical protein